jgi:ABC-type polysaccharide/polyol phosphate transport system ATPase subunit
MSIIEFDHISKRFRLRRSRPRSFQELFLDTFRMRGRRPVETIWSLRDASFCIEQGEMMGLIGANGAGKSTALKLVSRIIEPTAGRLAIHGKVTGLLELGAGFHPDLTGRENVFLNGAIMGMKRKEVRRRLDRIVAFAELEEFIDVPVKHYSSGMYMRLGFATAVHADADVLLVDEVLAVGDQAFQSKCHQRIAELRRNGVTILFVSHDANVVRRLCDRAIWLDKGRVRSVGDADNVIADYMDQVWHERSEQVAEGAKDGGLTGEHLSTSEHRWGSGEAIIEKVVFMGPEGDERQVFRTGEPFVARIYYRARERVERPAFGTAIYRDDGAHVNGSNSCAEDYQIDAIEGWGQVDYAIEALPLLPGRYEFTAAIYDHSSTHPFDHRHRAFTFEVQAGRSPALEGLVHIPGGWKHEASQQGRHLGSDGG